MKRNTKQNNILDINADTDLILDMAEDCSERGQHTKAVSLIRRVLKQKPKNSDAMFLLAEELSIVGLPHLACDILFEMLTKDPTDEEILLSLGENFYAMGMWDLSAYYLKRYSQTTAEPVLHDLDSISMGFTPSAQYTIVHPMSKAAADDMKSRANVLMRNGKIDEAISVFNEIETAFPRDYATKNDLSFAYLLNSDYDKAVKYANEALKLCEDSINALCNLAMAYNASQDIEKRDELADRLYVSNTENPQEVFKIATTFCEIQNDDYAYVWLKKFVKAAGHASFDVSLLMAFAAFNSGRIDESLQALNQILVVDPENTIVQYYVEYVADYLTNYPKGKHPRFEYYPQIPLPILGKWITELRSKPDYFGMWSDKEFLRKIKWALDTIEDQKLHDSIIEKIAMTDKEFSTPYLKKILLNQNVSLNSKGFALYCLLQNDVRGRFFMVRDGYFTTIDVMKNIPHIVLDGVLLCISKLSTVFLGEEHFVTRIVSMGKKIENKIIENEFVNEIETAVLAAMIARQCRFEILDDKYICDLFNVTYPQIVELSDALLGE